MDVDAVAVPVQQGRDREGMTEVMDSGSATAGRCGDPSQRQQLGEHVVHAADE